MKSRANAVAGRLVRGVIIIVALGIVITNAFRESGGPTWAGVSYVDVDVALPATIGRVRVNKSDREDGHVYSGTAFATAVDSVWATARHVAEGCRKISLNLNGEIIGLSRVVHDRDADLSLLFAETGGGVRPALGEFLPLEDYTLEGFAMGYPEARPASVHLGYLGRVATGHTGTGRARWVAAGTWQIWKTGLFDRPDLSGISGGPLFDEKGGLLGIVVSGQPRRARVTSIDPVNLVALMDVAEQRERFHNWRHAGITAGNANEVREKLVEDRMLAKVICRT